MKIDENLLWILSFYRNSEITGALFFGELARLLRPSSIQTDLTRHFADEAQHARYWTDCIVRLGAEPLKMGIAYQDKYVTAAGLPVNMMEILAITHVFEHRVISQYEMHYAAPKLNAEVRKTLEKIMVDERWHLRWIADALKRLEDQYGQEHVGSTLERFAEVDRAVYSETMTEHEERVRYLLQQSQ